MSRRLIKRYLPDHGKIRDHKHLRFFGKLLHDPHLWHLNRRSVSGACAVGLFSAFVPIPFQMALAAGIAMVVRVNLPIAASLVWITNPVTMPPIFYIAYKIGAWILREPERKFSFELSFEWLANGLHTVWQPFLLGCFVLGTLSAATGYALARRLWRWRVVVDWQARGKLRQQRKLAQQDRDTPL
jgi:uncharacterized protein (DUF2062 family)